MAARLPYNKNRSETPEETPEQKAFREAQEAQKKKDEEDIKAGILMKEGTKRFVPMQPDLYYHIYNPQGIINKYYQDTIDKIYEAMKAHKVYYDETMAQCNYPVKDIIPTKDIIRNHIFTLEAFLFGWFALEVRFEKQPNSRQPKVWYTEVSKQLIRDFVEDVVGKKTPRILRGV